MTVLIPSVTAPRTNQRFRDGDGDDTDDHFGVGIGNITSAHSTVAAGSDGDSYRSPGPRLDNVRTSATPRPPSIHSHQKQQCISPIRNVGKPNPFPQNEVPLSTPRLSAAPFSGPFPLRLPTALSQCHDANQKERRTPRSKSYSYPSPMRKPRGRYVRLHAELWMEDSEVWAKKKRREFVQSRQTQLQQPHKDDTARELTVHTARRGQRGKPRPPSPIYLPKETGDDRRIAALPLLVSLRPDDGQEVRVHSEIDGILR